MPTIIHAALIACCAISLARSESINLSWTQDQSHLALMNHEQVVWQLVFDPTVPKPHFHPLATLDGEVLTSFEPADHPWHRGLWWSWKYINGVNYWEEDRTTGKSDGLTRIVHTKVTPADGFSAKIAMELNYHPPGQPPILNETRHLTISAPDADGTYTIDWKSTFTSNLKPVTLDRTLPEHLGGVRHGGYAGLSLRLAKDLDDAFSFQSRNGQTTHTIAHGKPAPWIGMAGPRGGIAIFDHPANPRHQPPWYLHDSPQMRFFSPSPIFNETLAIAAGESITFTYRIVVHSRPITAANIDALWQTFTQTSKTP